MDDINKIFDNPKNGANLENRTAKVLKDNGWSIQENQPYIDPNTGKQREIDIIASREHLVGAKSLFPLSSPIKMSMRLFIDCKNFPEPLGLYTKNFSKKIREETLLNNFIYKKLTGEFYKMNTDMPNNYKFHRYLNSNRVSAFKSTNNDERYVGIQGINQVLHAMKSSFYGPKNSYTLDFPVIIINDTSKIAFELPDESRVMVNGNFFYEIEYIINNHKQHFLIDIVSEAKLIEFLNELDIEFNFLREQIYSTASIEEHFSEQNQHSQNDYLGLDPY